MYRMYCVALLAAVFTAAIAATVVAAPMKFTHQGRLTDAAGVPVDGNVSITFRIFDSSADGSLIWSESHPLVSVSEGLFVVSLGSMTSLDADVFSPPSSSGVPAGDRYLEIEVGGEVISPRTSLVSTPYAIAAHRIDGDVQTDTGELFATNNSGSEFRLKVVDTNSQLNLNSHNLPSPGHTTVILHTLPDSAGLVTTLDEDDDGLSDSDAEMAVMPGTARVAIKTKGTGADKNRVVGTTNDTSAVVVLETDSSSIVLRSATGGLNQANMTAANARSAIVDLGVEDETTILLHSLDVNADGLADIAIVSACTIDSAYESTTFSYPNASSPTSESGWALRSRKSKTYQEMQNTESASKTALELACDSSTASTVWSADDFSGVPSTVTIQSSLNGALNPIEHSSGAHLTSGGNWINASDENLKENFRPVDYNMLLEQIESLAITEWNYKTESDEIRHIGPTAQEFERVFGVGSDGKTISTIDPAGISLAAIKGLLEKNEQLEREVSDLKTLVKKLIDSK